MELNINQLTGPIPAALGNLTNLRTLNLHGNELTGTIPVELGDLTNLWHLFLSSNELTGTIPVELGDLTNLQHLWLFNNMLTGEIPAALNGMAHLQFLYLYDNMLTGEIPPELENLANLLVFDVRNTGLCVTAGSELSDVAGDDRFPGSRLRRNVAAAGSQPAQRRGWWRTENVRAWGAPRNLTAVVGDGQVVLSWEAPASDGGAEITDYEYRINRRDPWISIGSTETTYTVTGLVNGTAYTFQVRAVNRIGTGRVPNQAEATPEAPEVFTLDFAHFANGHVHHLRSGVRERGECAGPSRPLLLRHRGRARGRAESVSGCHRRSGGPGGRCADGPDGDGTAGRTHDLDPRPRGVW